MKTVKNSLLLLLALLLCLTCEACGQVQVDPPVTLLVANDLHYLSPALAGDGSFFAQPKSYFDGKPVHLSAAITDAFLAEVTARQPKALILAGDLTLNGAQTSHRELVEKLQAVKAAGVDVLPIPGNHDVDRGAADYSGSEPQEAPHLTSAEFISLYEPLLPQRLVSRDEASFSYIYEAGEKLWILMLDANTGGQCFVKDNTLTWLESQLKTAKRQGVRVISVTHQNLYAHSDLLSFGYVLYNADKVLELYEKYRVQCNLSGHIHIQSIRDEPLPEMVTASLSITGNHYGRLTYDGRQLTYGLCSADVESYAKAAGLSDENLLDFDTYGTWYFEEVARVQAREGLADQGLEAQQIALMAETYARINSAYFRGDRIDPAAHQEGIELWHTQESFIAAYIDSMIASDGEKQAYTVKLP